MPRNRQHPIRIRNQHGVVVSFNAAAGYGFISNLQGEQSALLGELFVHRNRISFHPPVLRPGQRVTFDICEAPRGLQAVNVVLTSATATYHNASAARRTSAAVSAATSQPPGNEETAPAAEPKDDGVDYDGSDLDTDRFEIDVPEDLVCTICQGVLSDPTQTRCEHLFCRHCIDRWLRQRPSCPIDREPLTARDLRPAPRFIRSIIGGLRLRCEFADRGCVHRPTVDELVVHEAVCPHKDGVCAPPPTIAIDPKGSQSRVTTQRMLTSTSTDTIARTVSSTQTAAPSRMSMATMAVPAMRLQSTSTVRCATHSSTNTQTPALESVGSSRRRAPHVSVSTSTIRRMTHSSTSTRVEAERATQPTPPEASEQPWLWDGAAFPEEATPLRFGASRTSDRNSCSYCRHTKTSRTTSAKSKSNGRRNRNQNSRANRSGGGPCPHCSPPSQQFECCGKSFIFSITRQSLISEGGDTPLVMRHRLFFTMYCDKCNTRVVIPYVFSHMNAKSLLTCFFFLSIALLFYIIRQ